MTDEPPKYPVRRPSKRPAPPPTPQTVMENAVRLLAIRSLSRAELRGKLIAKHYPHDWIQAALTDCERLGYINDERALSDAVDYLASSGYGPRHIRVTLLRRGFAEPLVRDICARLTEQERDILEQWMALRQRQFEIEKDPRKRRDKVMGLLARRGFSPTVARAVYAKFFTASEEYCSERPRTFIERKPKKETKSLDPMKLLEARRKRLESEPDLRKRKEKAFRHLVSKGISFDDARDAVSRFFS